MGYKSTWTDSGVEYYNSIVAEGDKPCFRVQTTAYPRVEVDGGGRLVKKKNGAEDKGSPAPEADDTEKAAGGKEPDWKEQEKDLILAFGNDFA